MTIPIVVEPVVVRHHPAFVPVAVADIQVVVRRVAEMCEEPPRPLPAKRYHTQSTGCIEFRIIMR